MKRNTIFIIIGAIILLAGGAYFAGSLFTRQSNPLGGSYTSPDGSMVSSEISMEMTPAPEIPDLPKTASGIFINRTDNVITINAFVSNAFGEDKKVIASINEDGEMSMSIDGESQQIDVYVNAQTKLYRNVTDIQKAINENRKFLQEEVEEGNLDEFNTTTFVSVWGRKNGDRIIADTILYDNPNFVTE